MFALKRPIPLALGLLGLLAMPLFSGCWEPPAAGPGPSDDSPKKTETAPPAPSAPSVKNKTAQTDQANVFDWPHWRGPDRTGVSRETELIHAFPDAGPKILWRKTLGTGFSGLTISQGRVFTLFGEAGREKVVCLDAETGKEIWKVDSDEDFAQGRSFGPRSTPCVDGERVYALGASGKLHCLQAATGKSIWSLNVYDKFDMRRFFHEEGASCSPLIDGKKLIILAGIHAIALDKSNGEVIWRALEEKMNHSTPTLATLDGRKQLVVLTGENLVGLDPDSGDELWRHGQRGVNCVTPVIGPDDQIFTAASYGFGCQLVKISNGIATQVYKNNALATHHATAMLYKDHLYGFHDRPGLFKCVRFKDGSEQWSTRSLGKGKLIMADGQLIAITEQGELALAKPSPDGYAETTRSRVVTGTCYTAPSLANGKLYVRSDKEMVCIDMKQ